MSTKNFCIHAFINNTLKFLDALNKQALLRKLNKIQLGMCQISILHYKQNNKNCNCMNKTIEQ